MDEYLAREATAWPALDEALVNDRGSHGWSAAAVAAHVSFWMNRAVRGLEAIGAGTYRREDFAVDIDAENARHLPEWSTAPLNGARADLADARTRLLAAWSALGEPDDLAAQWFAGDTFDHYEEHLTSDGS